MKEASLNVTLVLTGPVVSGATAPGDYGVDLPFARNNAQQCYLPGSQVKGRLLESIKTLSPYLGLSEQDRFDWFGRESQTDNTPERGMLLFSDFVSVSRQQKSVRHRIQMEANRGAVRKGCYVVIEAPFGTGEEVEFHGTIRFLCRDEGEGSRMKDAIEKGLRWIPALGAQRSVGFGGLKDVKVTASFHNAITPIHSVVSEGPLYLELFPQGPFCLAKPRIKDNLFESDCVISGGALKGCLANTINRLLGRPSNTQIDPELPSPWAELGRHFSKIRCDHAFPAPRGQRLRPRQYPLSLVRVRGKTFDVALCRGPGLLNGEAPAFPIDWKGSDFNAVGKAFGWGDLPPATLRVRTAIDSRTLRADEGKLFAYEMIVPDMHVWHTRVDLSAIHPEADRQAVRTQLETLFHTGLKYLGKTKTDVIVSKSASRTDSIVPPAPIEQNLWVITLQTPALITDLRKSINEARIDPSHLFRAYEQFWSEVSHKRLELVRFFAQQRLLGGGYLHHRFQAGKPYNPYLLTTEHSVFVLRLKDASMLYSINSMMAGWLSLGLPLPSWVHENYPDQDGKASWRTCPFTPENGFGEIAINMECHQGMRPDSVTYKEV
jgi:hypothetical protein